MSKVIKRPRLVSVRVVRWPKVEGMYGVACDYDDGVTSVEPWGAQVDAEVMVEIRRRDICTEANLRRI